MFNLELDLKNKSLKVDIGGKPTFEIYIWVKKRKFHCAKKRAGAIGGDFFFLLLPNPTSWRRR